MAFSTKSTWLVLITLVFVVIGGALVLRHLLGFETLSSPGEAAESLDYEGWHDALERWVVNGRVNYDRVLEEKDDLYRFAATLAKFGPMQQPTMFPTKEDKLAYYVNAYNALTLLGVVVHWPLKSVHDVRGAIEPKAGFGFFYAQRFLLDGRKINLYNLEHKVIRAFGDARIHAAINCASASCPSLPPFAFTPADLDAQLDRVTTAFCSLPQHVKVDDEKKEIVLSSIFDWYKGDFEAHAGELGKEAKTAAFISHFVDAPTEDALKRGFGSGYAVVYAEYDWRLNTP